MLLLHTHATRGSVTSSRCARANRADVARAPRPSRRSSTMRAIPVVLICSLTTLSGCGDTRQPTAPAAATPSSDRTAVSGEIEREGVLSASGRYRVTVAPEVFGTHTPVIARFQFSARKEADGSVSGHFSYYQAVDGTANSYEARFTCFNAYDFDGGTGNRAKV